jgi:CheY-like chemotaxis protein
MLAEYLTSWGFLTREAADADAAVAQARHCDVAVMELALPKVSGLDVVSLLQKASPSGAPEVIVFTADVTARARASVAAAGIQTFLTKPRDLSLVPVEVLRVLCQAVRRGTHADSPPNTMSAA